jgi:peptide deformylase
MLLLILTALLALPAESLLQHRHAIQMRLNPPSFSGTSYTITEFPSPILRRVPNAPITTFDDALISKTKEMLGIMYEAKGVGLAAPQIGLNELLFVYNPSDSKNMERVVCNPNITKYSEETVVEEEGCLSLRSDDTAGQVARSIWIETEYQNELGQMVRRRLKDFEARVFQHEYDHLKGILCYDRFPPEDRETVQKSIENLLGLYSGDDAMVDPDVGEVKSMQPRPLSARWMPPLETEEVKEDVDQRTSKASGGFGMGGGAKKSSGNKKEKATKVRARDGSRSNDPRFKTSGKTPFASRK